MSPLCFQDAFVKRQGNEITEDKYLQSILNHCTGIRHGANKLCNNDTIVDASEDIAFAYDVNNPFTWAISQWIFYHFGSPLEDTTLILETLKGFRTSNVQQFKAGLHEMDKNELGPSRRRALCSRLATIALKNRDAGILEALLEVHGNSNIEWFFDQDFDNLKHKGHKDPKDLETIRVVENSEFKSMVKSGERFREPHALDILQWQILMLKLSSFQESKFNKTV